MLFKSKFVGLHRVMNFLAVGLLILGSASGQSSQEGEDSRTKEMRQMWQNIINRRPRRQVRIMRSLPPTAKVSANGQVKKADKKKAEAQPLTVEPNPEYRIASPTIPTQGQDIGITVWRLRPSQPGDDDAAKQGIKRLEHGPSSAPSDITYLTAERVEVGVPLREGEMVQLSVEAPTNSYLYIINREQYADGDKISYGAAYLIFPTFRINKGFNRVKPGVVVNIPAMMDDPPFFKLNRSSQNHVSEEITFIVSPSPIMELSGKADQTELTEQQFQNLQRWKGQIGRIELINGAGKAQTSEEAEAALSSISDGAKRLKQDSPMPQSIYRIARSLGEPLTVSIVLRITR